MSFGWGTGQQSSGNNPFSQQNNTGFGQQQNNQTGLGKNTGFGAQNNQTGFGQQNTGFGAQNNQTGFGQQNTGFGAQNNQTGFGAQSTGFGQQNNQTGIGQQSSGFGAFGQQQGAPSVFGQPQNPAQGSFNLGQNTQSSGAQNPIASQSGDYAKDVMPSQSVSFQDSISAISWMNSEGQSPSYKFATTSWDKFVKIFEVKQSFDGAIIEQLLEVPLPQPATCLAWNGNNSCLYAGCIDGVIKGIDLNSKNMIDVGKHNAGLSSLNFLPNHNVLVSTAYENNVCFWQNSNLATSIPVDNKIFTCDVMNNVVAGATHNEKLFFLDVAMIGQQQSSISDSVDLGKYSQILSVCLDKKAETIGLTTVDGRANISSLSRNGPAFKTNNIITFKSNKQDEGSNVVLYPVNAGGFNPSLECWFMTAGGDGVMSFWDYKARNKIKSFSFSKSPICAAKVSPVGNMVAYGLGNDWHIGAEGINRWPNLLGVHIVTDQEKKFNANVNIKK